jgi:hypothetical protein
LSKGKKYTLDKIIADGYDTKLSIFEVWSCLNGSFEEESKMVLICWFSRTNCSTKEWNIMPQKIQLLQH